ncbi:hypothetical protein BmR1_04g08680 [Babesia microti strain RI]|uniref:Uncharacterized protein n=1 Tax=Babesia microti (strain RI) TaxID=1133968 RepID=I7J9J7_BABMR|nr:hypothetical protein BmR1_04g08680 [Babesia microti strain RI]CCF75913.1 hypothetical protein BmR1_04g08680 [Babesia microti strain RI]|eukprot:XP_012650321.1 hypothetical protein BmR1_04g08680 [Babesia microti strain RI]
MDGFKDTLCRIDEKNVENLSQIKNALVEILKRHYNDNIDTLDLCKPFKEFRLNEIYKLQGEKIELLKKIKKRKLNKSEEELVRRLMSEVQEYEGGYSLKDKAKATRDIAKLLKKQLQRDNSISSLNTNFSFQESPNHLKLPAVNPGSINSDQRKHHSIDYSKTIRPGICAVPQGPTSKALNAIPSLSQMQTTDTFPHPKLPTMSLVKSHPHHNSHMYANEQSRRVPYPCINIERSKFPMERSPIPPIPDNSFPYIHLK